MFDLLSAALKGDMMYIDLLSAALKGDMMYMVVASGGDMPILLAYANTIGI